MKKRNFILLLMAMSCLFLISSPFAEAPQYGKGFSPPMDMMNVKPGKGGVKPVKGKEKLNLLSTFDWSSSCTPIRNQGNTGTCWIFGSLGEFEANQVIAESLSTSSVDYAEQDIGYYYPFTCWSPTGTGGNSNMVASYLMAFGSVNESDEPFDDSHGIWNSTNPKVLKVNKWVHLGNLNGVNAVNIDTIKQALAHGPVTTAISVNALDSWNPSWGTMVSPDTISSGWSDTDHCVVIVGWDDTKVQDGSSSLGAWKVRNSWGSSWGMSGYCWIGYGSAAIGSWANYYPQDAYETYNTSVTMLMNDNGWGGSSLGYTSQTDVYAMNKYVVPTLPSGNNQIFAVDIAAAKQDLSYDIEIYSTFNGTAPSGLLGSQSGSLTNAGIYSIELDTPIDVESADTVYIMIHLKTTGPDATVLPLTDDRWKQSTPGICYHSPTGNNGSWTDLTSYAPRQFIFRARVKPAIPPTAALNWIHYD
jgi:C1A family cysteine protease